MRLTALGKIIILMLVVGVAIGGYRLFSARAGGALGGLGRTAGGQGSSNPNGSANPNAGGSGQGSGSGSINTGGTSGASGGDGGAIGANGATRLELITSPTKRGWLQDQITKFNEQNAGKYEVKARFLETREAMHAVLGGRAKPVLWSPSSSIWAVRLAQAWKTRNANGILDTNDDLSFRVYLKSPMVWLTTRDKEPFLRPILGRSDAWTTLRALSTGRRSAPYGRFKWAHADPLSANSGFLTMAMILNDYAESSAQGDLDAVAKSSAFSAHLAALEKSAVRDEFTKASGSLIREFQANPSRYDCITAYESSALDLAGQDDKFVAIYPSPTVVSEHAVAALSGNWVTPEQAQGARAFLQFLGSDEALQDGVREHLRPARSSSASLQTELSQRAGQGFKQTFNTSELPPYTALNQVAVVYNSVARR